MDTLDPLDAEVAKLDQLRVLGRTDRARAGLARVLAADPQHAGALWVLAALHFDAGEYQDSARAARQLIAVYPDDPDGHIALAKALVWLDDPVAAEAAARRAVELAPHDSAAHTALARALRDQGTFGSGNNGLDALAALREATALDPDSTTPYIERAKVHYTRYEFTEAEAVLLEALRRSPGDRVYLAYLGCVLLRQARDEEAAELFRQSLRQLPDREVMALMESTISNLAGVAPPYAQVHRGLVQALGLPPCADQDLDDERLAQRLQLRGFHPFRACGLERINAEAAADCARLLHRSLALDPASFATLDLLLDVLHHHGPQPIPPEAGQPDFSQRWAENRAHVQEDPDNHDAWMRLISLAVLRRDYYRMADASRAAAMAHPQDADYAMLEAHAYLLMALPLEAVESAERGLAIDDEDFGCTMLLGVAQRRAGLDEAAHASLRRAVELGDQSPGRHLRMRARRFAASAGTPPPADDPQATGARLSLLGDYVTAHDPHVQDKAIRYCVAEADTGLLPADALAELRFAAAALLLGSDRATEALEQAHQAARLTPQRADVHSVLGAAALACGQLPQAETALRHSCDLDPDDPEPALLLAVTLHRSGRSDEADDQFSQAVTQRALPETVLRQLAEQLADLDEDGDPPGWHTTLTAAADHTAVTP
ncbi:tetratricopeptide repeat protein [Streptomyces sp. NPDC054933]